MVLQAKNNSSTFKDLETQIQGLSRGPTLLSSIFKALNLEKKFQDFQGCTTWGDMEGSEWSPKIGNSIPELLAQW